MTSDKCGYCEGKGEIYIGNGIETTPCRKCGGSGKQSDRVRRDRENEEFERRP